MSAAGDGVVLELKVIPNASRDRVVGWQDSRLKVMVQAPPEKGQANRAVLALLAGVLGCKPRDCEILRGDTGPLKRIRIRKIDTEQVAGKLAEIARD